MELVVLGGSIYIGEVFWHSILTTAALIKTVCLSPDLIIHAQGTTLEAYRGHSPLWPLIIARTS